MKAVRALNKERRHLKSDQLACCAVKAEELIEAEKEAAKERQTSQGQRGKEGGRGKKKTLSQKVDEGIAHTKNRSDERVAKTYGTNRTYVRDAAKLKTAPDAKGTVGKAHFATTANAHREDALAVT